VATEDDADGLEHQGAAPVLIEKAGETVRKALDMDSTIKKFFTENHRRVFAAGRAEGKPRARPRH
jgi:hypothetical protein